MNLKVLHRGLILVGVPLLCGICLVCCLFLVILETDKEVALGQKYKRIEKEVSMLVVNVYHLGYQMTVVVKDGAFDQLGGMMETLREVVRLRKVLFADLADLNEAKYSQTKETINRFLAMVADIIKSFLGRGSSLQSAYATDFNRQRVDIAVQLDGIYGALQRLLAESQEQLVETSLQKQESLRNVQAGILFAGLLSSVLLAFILARFFMQSVVGRLEVITDNARRLSTGQPLNQRLTGSDEIAEVDLTFHEMADALKQTMERERALFDNASDVICVLDRTGRFLRINPACWRVWGRRAEDLVGVPLIDQVYSEDRKLVLDSIEQAQTVTPALSFECRLFSSQEQLMETLWSVYWAESEESLFCVVHDVSERKKVQRMKREFLAMVSHDLRSPLTSITGIFELLSRGLFGELSAKALDKVSIAKRNVSRLLSLVNDLLDMEKLEAGQIELQIEPVEISDLLGSCLQEVEALAASRQVRLDLNPCQQEIQLDSDRIIQVVINLLSNAIKFSPSGGLVTLAARVVGEEILISVSDQGRGVPAQYRQSIFERFKQVEAADGKRKSGTGLGLPICKQLVDLHGGEIGVDSEEGKGSTFWIKLAMVPQAMNVEERAATSGAGAYQPTNLDGKTEPVNRAVQPAMTNQPSSGRLSLPRDFGMLQKGLVLVGVPVLFELVLVGLLTAVLVQVNQVKHYEHYLHQVTYTATRIVADFTKIGRIVSGERNQAAVNEFNKVGSDLLVEYEKMRALAARDPSLLEVFSSYDQLVRPGMQFVANGLETFKRAPDPKRSIAFAFKDREMLGPLVDRLAQYLIKFGDRLDPMQVISPEYQARLRGQQGALLIAGAGINLAISMLLVVFFSRDINDRLAVLKENELRLAREQVLRAPMPGRDEIARLDSVFHRMAISLNEALQKERAVFDNSQDVICAFDSGGLFRQVNSASISLWGFKPDQLLNSSVFELVVAEEQAELFCQFQSAKDSGQVVNFESRLRCSDGTLKDTFWSANWSAERELLFCVGHDVTKVKELERLKQEFLAMVSHDLRGPLNNINGVAELILVGAMGPLPELAEQKLQIVVKNVERLLNLINDLLDIAKLEAGEMQLSLEPTPVASILERSAQALEGMAKAKQVDLVVEAGDGLVNVDADRLIQALVNLLSNAIKFSPEGSTVTLSAEFSDGSCELKVADQGRGIPESYLNAIFERFKQVEAADGKGAKGTGLGLPIAKKIVEGHGGSIGVESKSGVGSSFWIRLPG